MCMIVCICVEVKAGGYNTILIKCSSGPKPLSPPDKFLRLRKKIVSKEWKHPGIEASFYH